ncbi:MULTISPECIES: Ig-like domain-containing protein [unclassified Sphingobacterium]|uniref:DUF7507 domain-containing protein n=1 Tax=unclassified Sphingobacterium TaxID=2609468 RepID=UPI0025EF7A8F|nr:MULTISPECIES: Ig-like domain-containing protein [unclassified Sphingobacterium]
MKSKGYFPLFLFLFMILCPLLLWADGSKDLYPTGVKGNRAYLISRSEREQGTTSFPFFTLGAHYVYVQSGETIATASSAQNIGEGRIRLTSPSGKIYLSGKNNIGKIVNTGRGTRQAEMSGPRVGYAPYEVKATEEGVWKIEFISPVGEFTENFGDPNIPVVAADGDWSQTWDTSIAAWDISVRDEDDHNWISGRVYTNVLNLHLNSGQMANKQGAFFGKYLVLTHDGFVYKVDGNGSNGIAFTSFVNNMGFVDDEGKSLYKSLDYIPQVGSGDVHDPRQADGNGSITHKILYTKPDLSMPAQAVGAVPELKTWLINNRPEPVVSDINLTGYEGTAGQMGAKGAHIRFTSSEEAKYKIVLERSSDQTQLLTEFVHKASAGLNEIYWNGLDKNGQFAPNGEKYPLTIRVEHILAEVHFPYMDMEINPNGILLERLDKELNQVESDVVYWDDSDIHDGLPSENSNPRINLEGISSLVNGHRWGTYTNQTVQRNTNTNYGNYSFGNEKAIDTWSYAMIPNQQVTIALTVKTSDLEILSLNSPDRQVRKGEEITYTLNLKNNGPSDAPHVRFNFDLPLGFRINHVDMGKVLTTITHEEVNQYSSLLDLSNHEERIVTVKATALYDPESTIAIQAVASLVRSADMIDPDATSRDMTIKKPLDAEAECSGQGCNNIRVHQEVLWTVTQVSNVKVALIKRAQFIDGNADGYMQAGEKIRYYFDVVNKGDEVLKDIRVYDPMITSATLRLSLNNLQPGQSGQIFLDYVITVKDYNARSIINSAWVEAVSESGIAVKDISGTTYDNDDPTITIIIHKQAIYLKKEVINTGSKRDGLFGVGDRMEYSFTIWNETDTTITDISLQDDMLWEKPQPFAVESLERGQHYKWSAFYTVRDEDVDRGRIMNSATVRANLIHTGQEITDISGTSFDNDLPTVTNISKRPVGVEDIVLLKQNQSIRIYVLQNDTEGSHPLLTHTLEIVKEAMHGEVSLNKDGQVEYRPFEDYVGTDEFLYTVQDANELKMYPTAVKIFVNPTTPIAVDDYVIGEYNKDVKISVLENDKTDGVELDIHSIRIVKESQQGTLMISLGHIIYQAKEGYTGTDSFTYQVKDLNGNWTNEARVNIEVSGFSVPNVFTPNGDGVNDIFYVLGTGYYDRISLSVWSRAGKEVYSSNDYRNDWNGDGAEDMTYFYVVQAYRNGVKQTKKTGYILITRKPVK